MGNSSTNRAVCLSGTPRLNELTKSTAETFSGADFEKELPLKSITRRLGFFNSKIFVLGFVSVSTTNLTIFGWYFAKRILLIWAANVMVAVRQNHKNRQTYTHVFFI